MKHKDEFQILFNRVGFLRVSFSVVRAFGFVCFALLVPVAPLNDSRADDSQCRSVVQNEADAVFNQAFSTVSTLSDTAVEASRRGTWRPDGKFRRKFFGQAARSLSAIRELLQSTSATSTQCIKGASALCVTNAVPKLELLEQFDQIFAISFPKGLRQLRRLQKVEREKFSQKLDDLPDNYISCN